MGTKRAEVKDLSGKNAYPSTVFLYYTVQQMRYRKSSCFSNKKKKLYLPQIRKFCKKRSTHLKNLEQRPSPLSPKFFLSFFFFKSLLKVRFHKNKIVYSKHFDGILITTQADIFVKDRRKSCRAKTIFNIFIFSNPFDNGSRWFLRGQRGV